MALLKCAGACTNFPVCQMEHLRIRLLFYKIIEASWSTEERVALRKAERAAML